MNKPFVGWMILFDQLDETREWIVAEPSNKNQGSTTVNTGEVVCIKGSSITSALTTQVSPLSALIGMIKSAAKVPLISVQVVVVKYGDESNSPKE
jgi:hypothetical protein